MSKAKSKTKVEKADFEDIVDVIEEERDEETEEVVYTPSDLSGVSMFLIKCMTVNSSREIPL